LSFNNRDRLPMVSQGVHPPSRVVAQAVRWHPSGRGTLGRLGLATLARVEVLTRRTVRDEVLLVLGVSLGASAVYAIVNIIGRLTAAQALSRQQATLNPSQAPGRPWLDLAYQLLGIATALVPALLAVHLLRRDHTPLG